MFREKYVAVVDGKVYLSSRRNLEGDPQANIITEQNRREQNIYFDLSIYSLITFGAEPDKLSPFSDSIHIILFILLLKFPNRFSVDIFKIIYIYVCL